jgi:hypothetical protein
MKSELDLPLCRKSGIQTEQKKKARSRNTEHGEFFHLPSLFLKIVIDYSSSYNIPYPGRQGRKPFDLAA